MSDERAAEDDASAAPPVRYPYPAAQRSYFVLRTSSLDGLVAQLARHPAVEGVVVMGSAGEGALTPASDYDLFVVLAELPAPLWLGVTRVAGRLTEVYFATLVAVERLAGDAAVPADTIAATQLGWLQYGRIAFDRAGRLRAAQERARAVGRVVPQRERDVYAAWFKVNYNVRQTRRIAASDDPLYGLTVEYRLLYGVAELLPAYFTVRREPWPGEKGAPRHLAAHDPDYLSLFRACVEEADRARKVERYAALAAATLAPLGGLWPDDASSITVELAGDEELTPDMLAAATELWESLIGGAESPG